MDSEFHSRMRRIEELVKKVESAPDPDLRTSGLELIRSFMEFHATALHRMMETIAGAGQTGRAILERFVVDDVIRGALLLYGLHPVDLETRVQQALDRVRPYLRSHGGNVELVGVDQGVVKLCLEGSCSGCPSSRVTLELAVEQAIYDSAPDVAAIEVEGLLEQAVWSERNGGNGAACGSRQGPAWQEVTGVDSLASGTVRLLRIDDRTVLFCRLEDSLYAYSAVCSSCSARLEVNQLEGGSIVCPACGQRYDPAQAGRSLTDPAIHLEPIPALVEQGQVKVALLRGE